MPYSVQNGVTSMESVYWDSKQCLEIKLQILLKDQENTVFLNNLLANVKTGVNTNLAK